MLSHLSVNTEAKISKIMRAFKLANLKACEALLALSYVQSNEASGFES